MPRRCIIEGLWAYTACLHTVNLRRLGRMVSEEVNNIICKRCGRQFIVSMIHQGYSDDIKQQCLKLYVNGIGFRAIGRSTGVHHTTIINWPRQIGEQLPDT